MGEEREREREGRAATTLPSIFQAERMEEPRQAGREERRTHVTTDQVLEQLLRLQPDV